MSRRRSAAHVARDAERSRDRGIDDPAPTDDPESGPLAGYRLIRRVAIGGRADLFLAAAEASGSGAMRDAEADPGIDAPSGPPLVILRVYRAEADDASVALEIGAMSTDATGTLPRLLDVATLDDGRCALAVERIAGPTLSRLLADRTLTPGESVTILAPIVVAAAELARHGYVHSRLAASDVLIDERGRPRLIGLGALRRLPERGHLDRTALLRDAHAALAALISDVAAAVQPSSALDAVVAFIRERIGERPFQPCEPEIERRLFDVAHPEPIRAMARPRSAHRLPARVVPAEPPQAVSGEPGLDASAPQTAGGFARTMLELAQLPGDVASRLGVETDRVRALGRGVRDRLRAKSSTLTVGGLIGGAALVVLLTLVPPATADDASGTTDDAAPRTGGAATADATGEGASMPEPAPGAEPPLVGPTATPGEGGADAQPIAAAAALLERRAECFHTLDLGCLDEVVQPGSAAESNDRTALVAAREGGAAPHVDFDLAALTVTTEMGGAVLVTAPWRLGEREPASLLMVKGEAGWRLREIFG